MMLLDVNVLIYAFRDDAPQHEKVAVFMDELTNAGIPFGTPEACMASVVRICSQGALKPAVSLDAIFGFCGALRAIPMFRQVRPSERHWDVFQTLVEQTSARGKLVADAYLAAFAIERDDEWVTNDRDFSRFPGLRWRNPFTGQARMNPR